MVKTINREQSPNCQSIKNYLTYVTKDFFKEDSNKHKQA